MTQVIPIPTLSRIPRIPFSVQVAIAAIFALSLGAYFSRGAELSSQGRWLTRAEATAEYRQEEKSLTLARGWRWPSRIEMPGTASGAVRYEQGFAAGRASIYWFCSWATVATNSQSSPELRKHALQQLPLIHETPLFTDHLLDGAIIDAMVRDAIAGRTNQLAQWTRSNCQAQP